MLLHALSSAILIIWKFRAQREHYLTITVGMTAINDLADPL